MGKSDSMTPYMRKRRPGQRPSPEERKQAQEIFLQSFALTANVRAASMKAGISRNTVYEWQEKDEEFGFKFRQASEDANDLIRGELFRRAVQGYDKPVVSMGKVVYQDDKPLMERVYSDSLLSLLAKARMPEFRDKQHLDVNANLSGSVQTTDLSNDLRLLTNEQLTQFKSWLAEAKAKEQE
jgi:hypothetical protein